MTVSNSHVFSLTRDEIIIEALEMCGAYEAGQSLPAHVLDTCNRSLNMFFKSWQPQGLFLHTYKTATLFLQKNQQSYLLGPTGDHATESYVETATYADMSALDVTMSVDSETGINIGDNIGVVLDSGAIHWSTVDSLLPLTLAIGVPSAASAGAEVYVYTNKIIRPLKISDVRVENQLTDQPISKIPVSEYMGLPSKDSTSAPSQYAYDPQLDNARLYVWPVSSYVTEKINFLYQKPVDDFTTDTDTATAPADWLQCLTLGLAYTIAPKFQTPLSEQSALKTRYDNALSDLDDFEETSIFFAPVGR